MNHEVTEVNNHSHVSMTTIISYNAVKTQLRLKAGTGNNVMCFLWWASPLLPQDLYKYIVPSQDQQQPVYITIFFLTTEKARQKTKTEIPRSALFQHNRLACRMPGTVPLHEVSTG
jgi:hypothetical protein